MDRYRNARVHLVLPGYSLRATDNNPFANEQFFEANAVEFYSRGEANRRACAASLRNTNYGVWRPTATVGWWSPGITGYVPAGWEPVGEPASREDCLARIDELWTDMRPASLRAAMSASAEEQRTHSG